MDQTTSPAANVGLLDGLTDAQREAVTHFHGPLLILAGPGSGKTRVVTHRVAWLLEQGVPAQNIVALTFTNKAAEEMARRIERLTQQSNVWVGTFHRFCARLLRKYAPLVGLRENYTIYDVEDSLRALRQVMLHADIDSDSFTPEEIAKGISWAKNHLITPADYRTLPHYPLSEMVRRVYPLYQRQLAASNAADFDDLLYHVAILLRENDEIRAALDERHQFILVDEYQDTNLAQYAIARTLSIDHPNLAVTGDPDQSIYGWRGANLGNILDFERDYPTVHVVRLERNYRSTQRILQVAGHLIAHNVRRKEKQLFTENGPGVPVRLTTYANQRIEAETIAGHIAAEVRAGRRRPRDFAIFYRVNALSRALEFALRELGVPYQMVHGLEFFQRREIKDILAYLHLINNPRDQVALLRVVNVPPRGVGKTTVERLIAYAASHGLELLDAARQADQAPDIGARPAKALKQFAIMLDRLAAAVAGSMEELLGLVLKETGYQQQLRDSDTEEDQQRLANIEELLTVARDFDERHSQADEGDSPIFARLRRENRDSPHGGQLEAFLEETCLVSDTDDWQCEADRVTLMTLHASKGLEFPVVFIVAIEEGLLPHERSREHPEQLEEERRLMFVGMTRAQQELYLSLAQYRDFRGRRKMTIPSSFLMELPRSEMELEFQPGVFHSAPAENDFSDSHHPDVFGQDAIDPSAFYIQSPQSESDSSASGKSVDHGAYAAGKYEPVSDKASRTPVKKLRLTTAAALAGKGKTNAEPDEFYQGQWIVHATYGLGEIVALSGSGAKRRATIEFRPPVGRKSLLLKDLAS